MTIEVQYMRKTLQDVAIYLKEIMVPETNEAYAINPVYANASDEESIRVGIQAFRAFLSRLYDVLSINGNVYDNSKKIAHEYENRTTLSVYYPFLHNVSTILKNIGYHGEAIEKAQDANWSEDHGNRRNRPWHPRQSGSLFAL